MSGSHGRAAWARELRSVLNRARPTLEWLPDHVHNLLGEVDVDAHLLTLTSDLCDAGHVHLDILLWLVGRHELVALLVGEEHYDRGPEDVETTFETTLNRYPLDHVTGVQVATAAHPDGHQLDVSLGIMIASAGLTGHADPMTYDDPDLPSYALTAQPTSLTFTADPARTGEIVSFASAVLSARDRLLRGD